MPFGQKHVGNEGGNDVELWRKNIPGRENSSCKGPDVGPHLPSRNSNGAGEAGDG